MDTDPPVELAGDEEWKAGQRVEQARDKERTQAGDAPLFSSFAVEAANPAAAEDDPGACGRSRRLLEPPVKPAGDE